MGDRTKIDWADATWNPVTGCYHDCPYCYARKIAKRFGSGIITGHDHLYDFDKPKKNKDGTICPYPYGFDPTFHRYKLDEPQHWKKPRNIFVCSMADLFGDWVPDEWIIDVMEACRKAPQHRYLFLTKNGARYTELSKKGILPVNDNFWYGTSVPTVDTPFWWSDERHTFVSIEPILGPFDCKHGLEKWENPEWMIVGAETGNRKDKVVPQKDWIDGIVEAGKEYNIPVFMKESLREIMGTEFAQEVPW